ncbi:MAG: hypothetical protein GY943_15990 [Chloroflexi bacterium]|nr:hypothetical protein [Chloroflexota bacterium]
MEKPTQQAGIITSEGQFVKKDRGLAYRVGALPYDCLDDRQGVLTPTWYALPCADLAAAEKGAALFGVQLWAMITAQHRCQCHLNAVRAANGRCQLGL